MSGEVQPCPLLSVFMLSTLLHTVHFMSWCCGTCRDWDRDVCTNQRGPSAACKCLPKCEAFLIGHGRLCNVVMFCAERKGRATGRQTASMNLVRWLYPQYKWIIFCTLSHVLLLSRQKGHHVNGVWLLGISAIIGNLVRRVMQREFLSFFIPFHFTYRKFMTHTLCTLWSTMSLLLEMP